MKTIISVNYYLQQFAVSIHRGLKEDESFGYHKDFWKSRIKGMNLYCHVLHFICLHQFLTTKNNNRLTTKIRHLPCRMCPFSYFAWNNNSNSKKVTNVQCILTTEIPTTVYYCPPSACSKAYDRKDEIELTYVE